MEFGDGAFGRKVEWNEVVGWPVLGWVRQEGVGAHSLLHVRTG